MSWAAESCKSSFLHLPSIVPPDALCSSHLPPAVPLKREYVPVVPSIRVETAWFAAASNVTCCCEPLSPGNLVLLRTVAGCYPYAFVSHAPARGVKDPPPPFSNSASSLCYLMVLSNIQHGYSPFF